MIKGRKLLKYIHKNKIIQYKFTISKNDKFIIF